MCLLWFTAVPVSGTIFSYTPRRDHPPVVDIWLTEYPTQETYQLPRDARQVQIHVERTLFPAHDFVFVWKKDGIPWYTESKRIPADSSFQQYLVEGGRDWTLEIQTLSGKVYATVTLRHP